MRGLQIDWVALLTFRSVIAAIVFLVIYMRRQKANDDKSKFYTHLAENNRVPEQLHTSVPLTSTRRKEVRLVVVHSTQNRMENVLSLAIGETATASPEDWASDSEWCWVQSRSGDYGYFPKEWLRVQ